MEEVAERIALVRSQGHVLDAEAVDLGGLDPYDIQQAVHQRMRANDSVVGFKLGYTSPVMRAAMGISAPNHGPLTTSMVRESPSVVSGLLQPKVEPEIAVEIDADRSVGTLRFSLEVVDSVWRDYQFSWAHNTADGSSAAFAILGQEVAHDPAAWHVRMRSSVGSESEAIIGDNLPDLDHSVRWLIDQETIRPLEPGDVVLTGGLAAPIDLPPGGWIEAEFRHEDVVESVRVQRSAQG